MSADDARESWFEERQSAWLYRRVAAREPDPGTRAMFLALAAAAEQQADIWRGLWPAESPAGSGVGSAAPEFVPSRRARLVAALVDRFGPRYLRHVLAAIKVRGVSVYRAELLDPHGHDAPADLAAVGNRHRGISGGNLRAAVFGVNDGLVSNASLIVGIGAASQFDPRSVLIGGVAGWLAGALSMAAGEYISVRSQRELYEFQIDLERQELALYPEQEAQELALIYVARGMPKDAAEALARHLTADPRQALAVLAREELGLDPDALGSAQGAALASFAAFSVGALVPLLPFLLLRGSLALQVALLATMLALAGIGAALSLFTGRGAFAGAARMLGIGGGAGVVSYLLGELVARFAG